MVLIRDAGKNVRMPQPTEPDGPAIFTVTAEPGGLVRARGLHANAVFPGRSADEVAAACRDTFARVDAVLRPRWTVHPGRNLTPIQLTDLTQRVVTWWLYFYNINYGELRFDVDADLRHPSTYREIRWVVTGRIRRGATGHDELCAALCGLDLDDYRRWAAGDDWYQDR
jgi:hypothetical protein